MREYARRQLAKRGVQVRLGTAIAEITPNRVLLADGTAMPSDITIWAAGVGAPEPVSSWGLPQADGGLIVGDGTTGLVPQSAPAGRQAISDTRTDPTPTSLDPAEGTGPTASTAARADTPQLT